MIGQEITPPTGFIEAERPPTSKELSLWRRASHLSKKAILRAYGLKLQYGNILLTHRFAEQNKIALGEEDLPEIEARFLKVLSEIDNLKRIMCDVNSLRLGVRLSKSGQDLDVIEPPKQALGWVIPVIVGTAIVVGIIARWAHLERESEKISEHFNGVLRRADMALCKDPNSKTCQDWKVTKQTGGYHKKETIIGNVKDAIKKIGVGAKKGLGIGLALAIPLLMLLYLPRPQKKEG